MTQAAWVQQFLKEERSHGLSRVDRNILRSFHLRSVSFSVISRILGWTRFRYDDVVIKTLEFLFEKDFP